MFSFFILIIYIKEIVCCLVCIQIDVSVSGFLFVYFLFLCVSLCGLSLFVCLISLFICSFFFLFIYLVLYL